MLLYTFAAAAWILNFAFGFYSTSSIGEQACHPTYTPGRLLSTVGVSQLNLLRPGDLVFITLGECVAGCWRQRRGARKGLEWGGVTGWEWSRPALLKGLGRQ